MSTTNQQSSGRCWLFAALNVIRRQVASKHNLSDFELSQNYLFFWVIAVTRNSLKTI